MGQCQACCNEDKNRDAHKDQIYMSQSNHYSSHNKRKKQEDYTFTPDESTTPQGYRKTKEEIYPSDIKLIEI